MSCHVMFPSLSLADNLTKSRLGAFFATVIVSAFLIALNFMVLILPWCAFAMYCTYHRRQLRNASDGPILSLEAMLQQWKQATPSMERFLILCVVTFHTIFVLVWSTSSWLPLNWVLPLFLYNHGDVCSIMFEVWKWNLPVTAPNFIHMFLLAQAQACDLQWRWYFATWWLHFRGWMSNFLDPSPTGPYRSVLGGQIAQHLWNRSWVPMKQFW